MNRFALVVLACQRAMSIAPTFAQTTAPSAKPVGKLADKPLFRDPTFDGAADPVLIYNKAESKWFMFYTNRRARAPMSETTGVRWVHGTDIGIAESSDGGATWKYRGIADIDVGPREGHTYWAPDVFEHDGTWHMMLTVVPGLFDNDDLAPWTRQPTNHRGS